MGELSWSGFCFMDKRNLYRAICKADVGNRAPGNQYPVQSLRRSLDSTAAQGICASNLQRSDQLLILGTTSCCDYIWRRIYFQGLGGTLLKVTDMFSTTSLLKRMVGQGRSRCELAGRCLVSRRCSIKVTTTPNPGQKGCGFAPGRISASESNLSLAVRACNTLFCGCCSELQTQVVGGWLNRGGTASV